MGTWGPGGFENDAAADLVAGTVSLENLVTFFGDLPEGIEDPIDADLAQQTVAAAECVAALIGRPAGDLPADLASRLESLGAPQAALIEAARDALSRILGFSELTELWAEDDPAPFNRAITSLIERLNPDLPYDPPEKTDLPEFLQTCSFCDGDIAPAELVAIEINHVTDAVNVLNRGFWCHLACLNERLHPGHIVQNWKFDPAETARAAARLLKS